MIQLLLLLVGGYLQLAPAAAQEVESPVRYNATLTITPLKLTGIIGERRVYSAICPASLSTPTLLPFGGCGPCGVTWKPAPPSLEELHHWQANQRCTVGKICKPGGTWFTGDCMGDEARKLCADQGPYDDESVDVGASHKDYEYSGQCYLTAFRDTCTRDFECSLTTYDTDVSIFMEGDSVLAKVKLPDGKDLTLNDTVHDFIAPLSMAKNIAFFPLSSEGVNKSEIVVTCSREPDSKLTCRLPSDGAFRDVVKKVITLDDKNEAAVGNLHLKVHSPA